MKASIALLIGAASVVLAQDVNSLPQCGQTCINNMVSIAQSEFGCANGDIACYCTKQNFGYGIRDCANEACTANPQDAPVVIAFGTNYCSNFLATAASSLLSNPTGAIPILSSALATVTVTGGASSTGTGALATATGDASSLASAASSLASSAASAASSAAESIASQQSSISSSLSAALSSISSAANSAASSAQSAASSAASSATAGSSGAAPKMTAFPIAGAAGMAALLFL